MTWSPQAWTNWSRVGKGGPGRPEAAAARRTRRARPRRRRVRVGLGSWRGAPGRRGPTDGGAAPAGLRSDDGRRRPVRRRRDRPRQAPGRCGDHWLRCGGRWLRCGDAAAGAGDSGWSSRGAAGSRSRGRSGMGRPGADGAAATGPRRRLQALDAGQQGLGRVVGLGVGQPDQGHLEVDPRVGGVAHGHLGPPEHLHGPDQGGQPDPSAWSVSDGLALGPGHGHQLRGDQGQEPLPQVVDQVAGELLGAEPRRGQVGHGHQGPADVPLGQGLDHLVELGQVVVDRVRGRHLVEDREGVAGRAPTPPHGQVEGLVGHLEVGVAARPGPAAPRASRGRAGGTRSAGCGCGWWAAPSGGRWWPARRRRGPAAPPGS